MMKLTDVIAKRLIDLGVNYVFGLQGGAVVHIFDSLERNGLKVIYNLHEQSAALGAVAYAKAASSIGCCVTTTGPGGTNAITGVLGAWNDSVPCLFISGQVRSNHLSYGKKVRQVGTQEAPICEIVRPIVKEARLVTDFKNFSTDLDELIDIAMSNRPGPVWLDIPLEYQWQDIPHEMVTVRKTMQEHIDFTEYQTLLNLSERPVFVIGNGIHLSRSEELCRAYIKNVNVPFVTTWTAQDIFPTDHNLNGGVIGMSGQKGANQIMFEADLIICLGTHLAIPHTTTLYDNYAPQAKKIAVNIDQHQVLNHSNIVFDLIINSDLREFLRKASYNKHRSNWSISKFKDKNWYVPSQKVLPNSNVWNRALTKAAPSKTCFIVDGGGTALYAGFQSTYISSLEQRIICSSGMSSMGTGLAETVGAYCSGRFDQYSCIIGDCSFTMNLQDLQTIKYLNIPVVISVINNNGQLAIRDTQRTFQEGRYFGTHPSWGLTNPSIRKIANAFGIKYLRLDEINEIDTLLEKIFDEKCPKIIEVVVDENQQVLFKQKYTKKENGTFQPHDLSDMTP